MKACSIACALLAAICLSCTKETISEENLSPLTLSLGMSDKTVLSGTSVLWENTDQLSVFDGISQNRKFVTSDSGAGATFSGTVVPSSSYTVLYPYDADASISSGVISTSIPSSQILTSGSFGSGANVSCCTVSSATGTMKNVCAYAELTLAPTTYSVASIKFEAKGGESISGPVQITFSDGLPLASPKSGAVSYVTLSAVSPVMDGKFFFTLCPATLASGFKLTFTTADGKAFIKEGTKSVTFVRNGVVSLGEIDLSTLIEIEEEPDDTSADPTSAYASFGVDFKKLTDMGHPRLFLTNKDFVALKKRVTVNPDASDIVYKLHRSIISLADDSAASSEVATHTIVGGKRMLTQSRNALMRMFRCAYAYKLTGEEKYLTKARTELSAVCAFEDWNAQTHFLDPSEMALAVAVVYDWLYYDLTLEERTAAHAALKNFELTPFAKYTPSTTSNWNMVCNGGAIAAAVVVYEKDKSLSAKAIDKAIKSNLTSADYYYNPNGNGLEGNGYWSYAISYQMAIINALETAFGSACGIADIDGLKKTGAWKLFMGGPTGGFNFSDSGSDALSSTPHLIWLAARYNQPELLVREWAYLDKIPYSSDRLLPLDMCGLVRYPIKASPTSFPTQKIWSANDKAPIILTRIGWKYDNTDKFFGLKGSGTVNGHCHMDAGSFVYDAFGVRWACDSHAGDYNTYEHMFSGLFSYVQKSLRWELLQMNCYFHNTLSFNWADGSVAKTNVTDHVVGSRGSVVETFADETIGYGGTVDISCYYADAASSVKRTVKIVGDELHVIDRITAKSTHSAPFEFRMLTETKASAGSDCITMTGNGKTVYLYTRTSDNVVSAPVYGYEQSIIRPSTWVQRDWETKYNNFKQYHVVKFASEVAAGKTATFTTVISPVKPSESGANPTNEVPDFDDPSIANW